MGSTVDRVTAGGSAARRAQRLVEIARELTRRAQAAHAEAARWSTGSQGEQDAYTVLLALAGQGWRLLADRRWPGTRSANVDLIMIGPTGVYVIDVKSWQHPPVIRDGRLYAGTIACDDELRKLGAMTRPAERAVAGHGMSPVGVHAVMVFTGHRLDLSIGRVRLLGLADTAKALVSGPKRLSPSDVDSVTAVLAKAFPAHQSRDLPAPDIRFAVPPTALFDVDELAEATLAAASARSLERWMTFLDPSQLLLVRRDFGGPARVTGAAGTGKSVVGLHRAVRLAKESTGRILFTTLVRNLPRVQANLIARVEPGVADRVECVNLHAWARDFLRRRGVRVNDDPDKAETAYSMAWMHVGRPTQLSQIDPDPQYWQDEITYVIKGRAIRTLDEYLATTRTGRHTRLPAGQRRLVWTLYEEYQREREERGVGDHADLLLAALEEIGREPLEPGYDAVIADEVQDLPLTGIRLLAALAPGGRNGLLLIGDSRQSVYPGGYRLADAGLSIVGGRAVTLTVNYRNAAAILDAALDVVADQQIVDIDGRVASGRPAVEATYPGGVVTRYAAPTAEQHDKAMVAAISALDNAALANTAVLCSAAQIRYYCGLLRKAGIPAVTLDVYDGTPTGAVKVGTIRRGKGLEFAHVFLPHYHQPVLEAQAERGTRADRLALARQSLHVAMSRARDTLWLGSVE